MRYPVAVQSEHLRQLRSRPLVAISELIWNALDADASDVRVTLRRNPMQGIDEVVVADNGTGMSFADAVAEFPRFGYSWKRLAERSRRDGRRLHGQAGQGRWRAFGLGGNRIRWRSVTTDGDRRMAVEIALRWDDIDGIEIRDAGETDDPVGTTVTVDEIADPPGAIVGDEAASRLAAEYALYLAKYPARVEYDGHVLDPTAFEEERESWMLPDGQGGDAEVTVITWRPGTKVGRTVFLCGPDGFAVHEVPISSEATFPMSVFVASDLVAARRDVLAIAGMDDALDGLLRAVRTSVREFVRRRNARLGDEVVRQWRAENVYPFPAAPPEGDLLATATQELFGVIAVTAAPVVNATSDARAKKLSLRLLAEALENGPTALRRVLQEVLDLPASRLEEFDELLRQTTLASLISTGRIIADRLAFLAGLEAILFSDDGRKHTLERRGLHRILAQETWIFGEEFALSVDDQSLTEVLRRHLETQGLAEVQLDEVRDGSGRRAIIDLMLSRSMAQPRNRREHLVVELKRPSVNIGVPQLNQIENYAFAVTQDARFDRRTTEWDFVVVANELEGYATERAFAQDRPPYQIHASRDGNVRIWAKPWSVLIEDARHRLKFVEQQLGVTASADEGLAYLRRRHEDHLPPQLRPDRGPAAVR